MGRTHMIPTAMFLAVTLIPGTAAPGHEMAGGPSALERKLHGKWTGPACGGNLTLRANGSYEWTHYGPANQSLSGTWVLRWDALPPTLIMTCKEADYVGSIGTVKEFKLIQLDNDTFTYRHEPNDPMQYKRTKK
jgi:hypothetical protein